MPLIRVGEAKPKKTALRVTGFILGFVVLFFVLVVLFKGRALTAVLSVWGGLLLAAILNARPGWMRTGPRPNRRVRKLQRQIIRGSAPPLIARTYSSDKRYVRDAKILLVLGYEVQEEQFDADNHRHMTWRYVGFENRRAQQVSGHSLSPVIARTYSSDRRFKKDAAVKLALGYELLTEQRDTNNKRRVTWRFVGLENWHVPL